MASRMQTTDAESRHRQHKVMEMLDDVVLHVREDIPKIEDPKIQALFETTAEVLTGLVHAFQHADEKSEQAWR